MNVATDILLNAMVDRLVAGILVTDAVVGCPIIGEISLGFIGGGFPDEGVQCCSVSGVNDLQRDLSIPLDGSDYNGLVAFVAMPLTDSLAANKGFVDFNDSLEFDRKGILHRPSDTVAEIPGGLVGHTKGSLELIGRNTFLGFNHQVCGQEPFAEGKMGVM